MITTLLFDLDGLLSDTERLHRLAYQDVLRTHGVALDDATYADHWIRSGKGIDDFIREHGLVIEADVIRQEKSVRYRELVRSSVTPMPGVPAVLERLAPHKTLALASSAYGDAVDMVTRTLGIAPFFPVMVSRDDVERVKPWPDLFLEAARRLGVPPSDCLVLEDAEKGIIAAHRAGMQSIAIPNEYTTKHDFSLARCVLTSLDELTVEMIERL